MMLGRVQLVAPASQKRDGGAPGGKRGPVGLRVAAARAARHHHDPALRPPCGANASRTAQPVGGRLARAHHRQAPPRAPPGSPARRAAPAGRAPLPRERREALRPLARAPCAGPSAAGRRIASKPHGYSPFPLNPWPCALFGGVASTTSNRALPAAAPNGPARVPDAMAPRLIGRGFPYRPPASGSRRASHRWRLATRRRLVHVGDGARHAAACA